MPVGAIKSPEDEMAWEHAKEIARREYPDATGARFCRIVMGIYKRMTGYGPTRPRRKVYL